MSPNFGIALTNMGVEMCRSANRVKRSPTMGEVPLALFIDDAGHGPTSAGLDNNLKAMAHH
jgi:hypothetical protein